MNKIIHIDIVLENECAPLAIQIIPSKGGLKLPEGAALNSHQIGLLAEIMRAVETWNGPFLIKNNKV